MSQEVLIRQISDLPGPILVTGAGGFIGAHLYSTLRKVREDVYGTTSSTYSWRLSALEVPKSTQINLSNGRELDELMNQISPRTIFNLAAYGAYSHQKIAEKTYQVNLQLVDELARWCIEHESILIQSGSSSEYGTNCVAPLEKLVVEFQLSRFCALTEFPNQFFKSHERKLSTNTGAVFMEK